MKKIMFNDKYGLTQAVLDGRKTQTRRVVTERQLRTILHVPRYADRSFDELLEGCICNEAGMYGVNLFAPFARGEEVAVAQSYLDCGYSVRAGMYEVMPGVSLQYSDGSAGFTNKMFVSADLMPHRIRITNVRVERLQDISDEDCLKEGVIEHKNMTPEKYPKIWYYYTCRWIGVQRDKYFEDTMFRTARDAYAALIDKVSGKGTWESNPWVFVYDFELVK